MAEQPGCPERSAGSGVASISRPGGGTGFQQLWGTALSYGVHQAPGSPLPMELPTGSGARPPVNYSVKRFLSWQTQVHSGEKIAPGVNPAFLLF